MAQRPAYDAEKATLTLTVHDQNQFWFVLSDGALPQGAERPRSVAAMREAANRQAVLLVRSVFLHNQAVIATGDKAKGPIRLEFQPHLLVSRKRDGTPGLRIDTTLALGPGAGKPRPAGDPDPEDTVIPDIGALIAGLEQTTRSLGMTDLLIADPTGLTSADEAERDDLLHAIVATKDHVLTELAGLGAVLAQRNTGSRETWLTCISGAVSATLEAMIAFDDFADHVREDKINELNALRHAIEGYFYRLDPTTDAAACTAFSRGINTLILEEHRGSLTRNKVHIESRIEGTYSDIIATLQRVLATNSTISFLPRPFLSPAEGFYTKFVFNMLHMVMAVQNGGLSIRLETKAHNQLHRDFHGWNQIRPPCVHITDRRSYEALQRR
ncbi:MAG: hypothetical protein P4M00_05130 [Azospirillaceae bacterium]|nr:hypothetical protein [Azospirillaceae bacterium]